MGAVTPERWHTTLTCTEQQATASAAVAPAASLVLLTLVLPACSSTPFSGSTCPSLSGGSGSAWLACGEQIQQQQRRQQQVHQPVQA